MDIHDGDSQERQQYVLGVVHGQALRMLVILLYRTTETHTGQ
jgi:hypothetical protein